MSGPATNGDTLKERSVRATFWSGVEIFLRRGLQFGVSIALARILEPEDFGTIGILLFFIGIASHFVDTGFSAALIQRKTLEPDDATSVFWFNIGSGALLTLGLWAGAPLIARFFRVPELEPLTRVMALTLFLSAFSAVQQSLLVRRLEFKIQAKIGGAATLIAGTVAVVLALLGAGPWALAFQSVTLQFVTASLLWLFGGWRPRGRCRLTALRRLFEFSGPLFGYFGLGVVYSRLYSLLIGRFYSTRELGFYSRANNTQSLPWSFLVAVISRTAFPAFSTIAGEPERFRRWFVTVQRGLLFLTAPIALGMGAVASNLIPALFGTKWLPSVPILQVLCLVGLFEPLHELYNVVLMASGRSRALLKADALVKGTGIVLVLATTPFGVLAMAAAAVGYSVAGVVIKGRSAGSALGIPATSQLYGVLPVLGMAVASAGAAFLAGHRLVLGPWPSLGVQVAVGAAVYLGLAAVFGKSGIGESLTFAIQVFRRQEALEPSRRENGGG